MRSSIPGDDQMGEVVPNAQSRKVLANRGGELGERDGALAQQ